VADALFHAQEDLNSALTPLSQGEVGAAEAEGLIEPGKKVKHLAMEVDKKIRQVAHPEESD
jgi:hypothetical protein